MDTTAAIFKSLGDPTRVRIMGLLLVADELCVCRFEEILSIGQSKASRHLRYLLNVGLLEARREAASVYYRISPDLPPEHEALVAALPSILGEERLTALRGLLRHDEKESARVCAAGISQVLPA